MHDGNLYYNNNLNQKQVGAWGKATNDGKIIQLRALDWASDAPISQNPAITVYHPTEGGNSFANIGFTGFVGSITAMSSKGKK